MMKKITLNKYLALIVIFFCALNFGYGQSDIIISQYIETNTGTSPKGVEIYNLSGADITFTPVNNLQIYQGTNGGVCTNFPGTNLIAGTLLAGETWVIGTTNLITYASTNGVNISGITDYNFDFNGNDALQLYLGGVIQDVFGTCGIDPGVSWIGGGVNTMDNNLQLKNGLCDGDIDGWADPSERFDQVADGITMTGFGNAPTSCTSCATTVTWEGGFWSDPPGPTTAAILNDDYNPATLNLDVCSLTVNYGYTLTIDDGDYVQVQNDIIVDGEIIVQPQGAVVQIDDAGNVVENGSIKVNKETAPANYWYEYTYWSSPVSGETIGNALSEADVSRRFWFDGSKFKDSEAEIDNDDNPTPGIQDDIDDNNDDWTFANGTDTMISGVGYASTHDEFLFNTSLGNQFIYTFEGPFNNGVITVPVYRNNAEMADTNWNFIGNPYPSAISTDDFFDQNVYDAALNPLGTLEGAIYLWSQNTLPSGTVNGNQNLNFSTSDYAIINRAGGVGNNTGGESVPPNDFVPSGQGFFVAFSNTGATTSTVGNISTGDVVFNNSMRETGNNDQFFRIANSKSKNVTNKSWFNLSSDNGVFNQILVAYIDGATNSNDGMSFDAPRNLSTGASAILYTNIEGSNKKFAIQGKAENSLNEDEVISLGFKTAIDVATIYTLSIAQLEGDFLNNNAIYVKDNLLNVLHDLKTSDYNFTSVVGEFNERFEIVFNSEALSTDEHIVKNKALSIIEQRNGDVQFKLSGNLAMASIQIIDLQGRVLYNLNANGNSKTYNLSNLSQAPYIAKVTLTDGYVITKKAIKRH